MQNEIHQVVEVYTTVLPSTPGVSLRPSKTLSQYSLYIHDYSHTEWVSTTESISKWNIVPVSHMHVHKGDSKLKFIDLFLNKKKRNKNTINCKCFVELCGGD